MSDLTRPIIGIENRTAQEVFDIMCDRLRAAEVLSRTGAVKVREDDLVATCKAAVDSDGEPLQMSFKGWPKDKGYRFLARAVLSSLEPAAPAEPDFAKSIAEVIKEESDSGAAAGWRSCTGCHETNEGYETGRYPYSTMFGCHVGHGCSECGGLGVVWEYWSGSALEAMARNDEPAAPEGFCYRDENGQVQFQQTTPEGQQCERCQGNGEIVTDWDRYRHPHEGDVGDEAVAECPDCNGEGTITSRDAPEGQQEAASPSDRGSAACTDGSENAAQPQPEQAVTEAAIQRATEAAGDLLEIDYDGDEPFIRLDSIERAVCAALKAATEVGR